MNRLYAAGLGAAAFFLALIAVVMFLQIVGRFIGVVIPSADDIAGYSMAASIFLALADTLRARHHIRVELILSRVSATAKRSLDLSAHALTACALAYFTFHSVALTWNSFSMGETSPGLLGIPVWLPQTGMNLGLALIVVACVDGAIEIWRGNGPVEESLSAVPGGE